MNKSYQSGCNCAGGPNKCSCGEGYSCCTQKGNEGYFGLCIKNESGCNNKTGFALKEMPSSERYNGGGMYRGGNSEGFNEGFSLSKDQKKNLYIIFAIVAIMIVCILIYKFMRKRKWIK